MVPADRIIILWTVQLIMINEDHLLSATMLSERENTYQITLGRSRIQSAINKLDRIYTCWRSNIRALMFPRIHDRH